MNDRPSGRRLARHAAPWLGSLAIQATSAAIGLAGLAATAAVVPRSWVFIGAGLLIHMGSASGLAWLVTRRRRGERRRRWLVATGALTLALILGFSATVLRPVADPPSPPAAVDDLQWWMLSDGARIGYTHTAPEAPAHDHPIVFLHGGPGVADLAGDTAYFGRLARDGYDVYVYDQLGTGHSSRLADPSGYTLERWAADLEEIRRLIGEERMILAAHSWGARIAARYLERHPGKVSQLILSSPGAIPGSEDSSGDRLVDSLPEDDRREVLSLILHPRVLASYGLLQVNPAASRSLTSDREIDARMDRVYNASRPAFHCPGDDPGPELGSLGFYAFQYPQSAGSPADPDLRSSLSGLPVPTLVLKGECDYLSWTSAVEYTEILPASILVYMEDAGHNAYQDRPDAFLASVRAFLRGDDMIPLERHDTSMPGGFRGPP
ncbi:MAG: alpha/beta fold hydrolase [Actinomycetota bacterium]